jgi:hypothetical protein
MAAIEVDSEWFMRNVMISQASVRYNDPSQMRYSGVSLTTARPFWHIFEISGRGVRGSGRIGC